MSSTHRNAEHRYAAYIAARERGATADEAARDAALHIEGTRERAQV